MLNLCLCWCLRSVVFWCWIWFWYRCWCCCWSWGAILVADWEFESWMSGSIMLLTMFKHEFHIFQFWPAHFYRSWVTMRHWQISNIICSVARLQNLAFIEVSPPPLYLCSWSAGFPIVRLKSSNDSAGTLQSSGTNSFFISTEGALRLPTIYDSHPSTPSHPSNQQVALKTTSHDWLIWVIIQWPKMT